MKANAQYSLPSIFLSSNSLDRAGSGVLQRRSITWKNGSFSNIHQFRNRWASLMAILRVVKNLGYVKPRPQSTKVREEIADVKLHIAGPGYSYLRQKKKGNLFHRSPLGQRWDQFLNNSCCPWKILLDIECLWSNSAIQNIKQVVRITWDCS